MSLVGSGAGGTELCRLNVSWFFSSVRAGPVPPFSAAWTLLQSGSGGLF